MRDTFRGQSPRGRRQKYRKVLRRENRESKGQTEQRMREKLRDRKRKMQWRVWKWEVVVILRLCTLSELELNRFLL